MTITYLSSGGGGPTSATPFEFGGTSTGTASQLTSFPITSFAFLQNTSASGNIYVGGPGILASVGASGSGYPVLPGGQVPLPGNNTNLTWVIGVGTYAVAGC